LEFVEPSKKPGGIKWKNAVNPRFSCFAMGAMQIAQTEIKHQR